ncbi:unnamed protein product [Somion occarium]|uniref:Uncharacterized protein n=1 Tax=Somion occarium TaxID=3059160 RepID=A0ABP1E0P7_9APHY
MPYTQESGGSKAPSVGLIVAAAIVFLALFILLLFRNFRLSSRVGNRSLPIAIPTDSQWSSTIERLPWRPYFLRWVCPLPWNVDSHRMPTIATAITLLHNIASRPDVAMDHSMGANDPEGGTLSTVDVAIPRTGSRLT